MPDHASPLGSPPLTPGTALGPYVIDSLLGAGGMGQVYRARDSRLGRAVALKVLPPAYAADATRLRRFEQESHAMAILNHPNIVAVHDVGQHEGCPYIVSELLEGRTLRQMLTAGRIPGRRVLDYAIQIAQGLAAAHDKGIVHRDLKPENILVSSGGHVKILDFGIAKLAEGVTHGAATTELASVTNATGAGVALGTIGYMSPEQIRGEPTDQRTDIFSLGVVLYEMAAGTAPFKAASTADSINALLNNNVPPLDTGAADLPPAAEEIIGHCMDPAPADRFQSAADVALALRALTGSRSTARAAARSGVRGSAARRASAVLLAAAAVVVIAWLVSTAAAPSAVPLYQQLSFKRGDITGARFLAGSESVIYSARWQGEAEQLLEVRADTRQSRELGYGDAALLAIASSGELAILQQPQHQAISADCCTTGTLARVQLGGTLARQLVENAIGADWSPRDNSLAAVRLVRGAFRLEYPLGTIIHSTLGGLSNPRFSPDGSRIAFFEHPIKGDNGGHVAVIDLETRGVRPISDNYVATWGLAWSGANEIWFAATTIPATPAIFSTDARGGRQARVLERVPARLKLADVAADGTALMIRDEAYRRMNALRADEAAERDLSWFDYSRARGLSADGRVVLFEETGAGSLGRYGVFVRGTDGSPAIRLGDGNALAISADGLHVLAKQDVRLTLLPTGPGEAIGVVVPPDVRQILAADLMPDGRRAVVQALEEGRGVRLYAIDFTGRWQAFTPDGLDRAFALSPDGSTVVGRINDVAYAFRTDGAGDRVLAGITRYDEIAGWTADSRELWIRAAGGRTLERLDMATGARRAGPTLRIPVDLQPHDLRVSHDGTTYVYNYLDAQSTLYRVEGLR